MWLRLIRASWESSPLGYICSYHALSFVRSLQCLRSTFMVRSGSTIPEPCCFLDSDRRTLAAHCFPALPASALRKAPHLPYGKLRFCLRKLRLCPTESSASAYGSSASALRKAPFSFSLCITSCNKLSFRNWILPSSLWHCTFQADVILMCLNFTLSHLLIFCVGINLRTWMKLKQF